MIVTKFGGSSVANADSISAVRAICKSLFSDEKGIVVVSALGGVTDKLKECGTSAAMGEEKYTDHLKAIEERHFTLCRELFPASGQSSVLTKVKLLINSLEDICRGVFLVGELTLKTLDIILSFGERLSAAIIQEYLNLELKGTILVDPTTFIVTDDHFGNANVDFEKTNAKIIEAFKSIDGVAVCPGFIAGTSKGSITTLGRGGSDYTAAILAGALQSNELQIWTDVDGMMTADPRYVPLAHPIEEISYEEALELSHFGARVIYPPTIQPALRKNIPIQIRNTFNPDIQGTRITNQESEQDALIKGLSSISNISLFNLKGAGMVGIPNFSNRLFRALSKAQVNVILITQASSEHTICVGISDNDLETSIRAINKEFEMEMMVGKIDSLETESGLSIIALVGSRMHHQVGVSGKMFSTLGENGVNIIAIAQGSSERNISAVISTRHLEKALNILHERFFLSERKRVNLFITGVGNVGGTLLKMIESQQSTLFMDDHIDIQVIGISNSRKMYFDQEGIPLSNWRNLINEGEKMDRVAFLDKMYSLNMRSSIFIDNTASSEIPDVYKEILENNISIVTPNKVACSSNQENYNMLKNTSRKFNSKFLFETNVGAGLPVISTLNDLIKSGDRIRKIEAVLSGSMNFIFNTYDGTRPFAEIVKIAQDEGYTEPDPRIDLSGKDVMRKILILIREAGIQMEIDSILNEDFVPQECMNANTVDEFYQLLEKNEDVFKALVKKAESENKRIKFVASYIDGKATTGLGFFDSTHPFFQLEGKDNIVLFTTDRYPEQPLVIKGAGAGAEVTASGIFADVIRIANT